MSYVVLANSTRVILPLRTRLETPERLPVLAGILVSQAKSSGHCLQCFIEMGAPGLPRPFRGERWCYEWRSDGDNLLACWLGFPNVFFSGGIDPNLRVAVEALGRFGGGPGMLRSLSRISVNVKSGQLVPGPGEPVWMPDDSPKPFPA
ncbi:MAG: hypothetical protein ABIW76_04300 [Fibrobacteria bacterium]